MGGIRFPVTSLYADESGQVTKENVGKVLNGINSSASWFGDPVLSPEEVTKLVDEIFTTHDNTNTGTVRKMSSYVACGGGAPPRCSAVAPPDHRYLKPEPALPAQLNYVEYMEAIVAHPVMVQFIAGKGSVAAAEPKIVHDAPAAEEAAAAPAEEAAAAPAAEEAAAAPAAEEAAAAPAAE